MDEFRTCPACSYERGFHVYFERAEAGARIGVICPSCGHSYDLGWLTPTVDVGAGAEPGPVFGGRG